MKIAVAFTISFFLSFLVLGVGMAYVEFCMEKTKGLFNPLLALGSVPAALIGLSVGAAVGAIIFRLK